MASRWPEIFRSRVQLAAGGLQLECQHGGGWYSLLDALCEVLMAHAREIGREAPQALRVFEEMGVLEFEIHEAQDEFQRGAIWAAASLSSRICEVTGAPGHAFICGSYLRTLAPEIAQRHRFQIPRGFTPAPLPPVCWARAFEELEPAARAVLVGEAEVPAGWTDIASLLLHQLSRSLRNSEAGAKARVFVLMLRSGRLAVEIEDARERDLGAVAFFQAVSRHIDPETGAAHVPNLTDTR